MPEPTHPATAEQQPPVNRPIPSHRAGLRDQIVNALAQIDTVPPIAHRRAQADHVLEVLCREWPWLRAEAEETAALPPADRADLRDRIAAAMREHYLCTNRDEADADGNLPCRCGDWREPGPMGSDEDDWDSHLADAALAVLPATTKES